MISRPQEVNPDFPGFGDPLPEDVLDNLVFVVGPARSGTAMLHRMMKFHPSILSVGKTVNFYRYFWRYRHRIDRKMLALVFQTYEWFRWTDVRTRYGAGFADQLQQKIDAAIRNEDVGSLLRAYPVAYLASGESSKDEGGINAWQIKSNDDECWGDIARSFPKAKLVIIIRDPRSTIYSQIQRMGSGADDAETILRNISTACLYENHFSSKSIAFSKAHAGNTKTL